MSIRNILSGLTPPALTGFYRRARGDFRSPWEGVYKNYRDVPASGSGYSADAVLAAMAEHTRKLKEALASGSGSSGEYSGDNLLLPFLAAAVSAGGPVRILDFGGGMGEGYLRLKAALTVPVDYHVVELERTCAEGRSLFRDAGDIFFHEALPQGLENVDIVHINSALQYIEDYAGLLGRLAACAPRYILLVRFSAVEIPTFAALQKNLEGTKLPYWFFNSREIIQLLAGKDYRLVYKEPAAKSYPQDDIPAEYRLPGGRMSNLLFSRAASRGI
ncbi:MAG: methyltransferase, TIGR04325 family [Elusimicrobiales bacterium]|nr:methyltransferase, TIGR04325 family [Elusimicrobiales bacterium]